MVRILIMKPKASTKETFLPLFAQHFHLLCSFCDDFFILRQNFLTQHTQSIDEQQESEFNKENQFDRHSTNLNVFCAFTVLS